MKSTGIVRRMDNLGRIVIPKEIRRTLRIREGDPLEIYTDKEGEIILKKYSPIEELSSFAKQYVDSLAQTTGYVVMITDRDQVIAASAKNRKEFAGKPISRELDGLIGDRKSSITVAGGSGYQSVCGEEEYQSQVISPIICEGDAIGSVIMVSNDKNVKFGEMESKLTSCAAGFLGKQMEQ